MALVTITLSCTSLPIRNPVPQAWSGKAQVPGISRARFWGDELPAGLTKRLAITRAKIEAKFPDVVNRPHNYLSISGGGSNGAFGAGLLTGWSEAGNRPDFTIVTGISTGALMAPFAYLGPAYDEQLTELYTTYSSKDLFKKRGKLATLTGDSAASTEPLQALLATYIDQKMLHAIAAEYHKGRWLFIGTTDLDAQRPVIWNIGAIAASGDPKALALVHKVLLASASIPGAFPPVYIEVDADGQRYDEMHVDGGATSQVFLYPVSLDWRLVTKTLGVVGKPSLYVIRNARLAPEWTATKPGLLSIVTRSVSSLTRTQGFGDLYRIYLGAQRDDIEYNLAYIPEAFEEASREAFDREYMRKLFDLGYRLAKPGYPWAKSPPGFTPP